ncbi:ABC transporter ATP-binding protein [Haloechinothrix sp. LS1_15]|uniref:ABC transporter ATP-binding protein n=1 Tax=Haloechinothrix sp. LS1_15 TaxID=2652248 RepID=UPI0029458602|nr:ABC transporter ATP-binding protein [Haloechinothrix sp. LS1_15]MDV6014243.1 ABC transporter ATP-binding protein [Haloechinothrix sp. LS1_15]
MHVPGSPAVEFDSVTKRFGAVTALDQLTLAVREGEIIGLLGPNGAGKTTALRTMLGLLKPTSGRTRVFGIDAWAHPVEGHRQLAYIPGEFPVWPQLTGAQMLDLLGTTSGAYDRHDRDELVERFAFDPRKRGRSYSKGNRQKIGVIAALMTRAPLLVMDEPSSGLDPLMTATFQDCLREAKQRGQTIVLSSHILSEVEAVCDRVAVLREGRLVEHGTLAELRHLHATTVQASYAGPAPVLDGVPGVANAVARDGVLRLQVTGPVDPLLKALATATVTSMQMREPSLEELFQVFYDTPSPVSETAGEGSW